MIKESKTLSKLGIFYFIWQKASMKHSQLISNTLNKYLPNACVCQRLGYQLWFHWEIAEPSGGCAQ